MIQKSPEKFKYYICNFWKHYKQLENDFMLMSDYIEISTDNFNTYSYKLSMLLQSICSEIDVIGKTMKNELSNDTKTIRDNIYQWWNYIKDEYKFPYETNKTLADTSVVLLDTIQLTPWSIMKENDKNKQANYTNQLNWWSDYNAVKHRRIDPISINDNYKKANLGNVCNAIAALYILEKSYMYAIGTKDDCDSFADTSALFQKDEFATENEMCQLYEKLKEEAIKSISEENSI